MDIAEFLLPGMPKTAFLAVLTLTLALVFAPKGPILAQETGSSTETINPFKLPTSPADGFIKEWIIEGKLKAEAQGWMNTAQIGLQDAAEQALGSAQQTAKDEIAKQAGQAAQGFRQKAEAYVGGAVAIIKGNILLFFSKIILFFNNLFFQS